MKQFQFFCVFSFVVAAFTFNTVGCGDGGNTVVQPGELTPEQEAEMANLTNDIENASRTPSKSGKTSKSGN